LPAHGVIAEMKKAKPSLKAASSVWFIVQSNAKLSRDFAANGRKHWED
jgi:hypothetical protein